MIRVVFDTVVFARSLINPYSFCGRAVFSYFHVYRLLVSEPLVKELLDVLHRPELTTKFHTLPRVDVARVIELVGQAELAEISQTPQVSRDPKDDIFLATASAAHADYLVSEDQDLLVLAEYEGVRIIDCQAFLQLLERLQAEQAGI